MKKWWRFTDDDEDEALANEDILELIKKEYVQESCEHEEDAYISCISCVMNHLLERVSKK